MTGADGEVSVGGRGGTITPYWEKLPEKRVDPLLIGSGNTEFHMDPFSYTAILPGEGPFLGRRP